MNRKRKTTKLNRFSRWFVKYNKHLLLIFTFLFSALLIIRATYAWETYSASKENKFGATDFNVKLKEVFSPNLEWEPGRSTLKKVYVSNEGHQPAFVRLRAEEFLLTFKIVVNSSDGSEGTGNVLVVKPKPATTTVKVDDVLTWTKGGTYEKSKSNVVYEGELAIPDDMSDPTKKMIHEPTEVARNQTDLKYISLIFGRIKDFDSTLVDNYWLYGNDGYYYYSQRLEPGQVTAFFMERTELSTSSPNRLKESLYKLVIQMEGEHSLLETLSDWQHDGPTDPIFNMLKNQAKN